MRNADEKSNDVEVIMVWNSSSKGVNVEGDQQAGPLVPVVKGRVVSSIQEITSPSLLQYLLVLLLNILKDLPYINDLFVSLIHLRSVVILYALCSALRASTSFRPDSPAADWYKSMLSDSDATILGHSGKMVLLFEILRMAEELDDKL